MTQILQSIMQAAILKCKEGSRFHFGEYSEIQGVSLNDTASHIHSDVLFGAFISELAKSNPEKVNTCLTYFKNKSLQFSSAFYCIEQCNGSLTSEYIYLLPKPLSLNLISLESLNPKFLKNVNYISKGVWEAGLLPNDWISNSGYCHMPDTNFVIMQKEVNGMQPYFTLAHKGDIPKVRVRTNEEDNNLYHQTDLFLLGNENYRIHWYFLIESILNTGEMLIVSQTINQMSLSGIGGERSTGTGIIESVEFKNFDLQITKPSDQRASISLTIPAKHDDMIKLLLYQTKKRGGMLFGGKIEDRLKVVQTILEGAVQSETIHGSIVDISTNINKLSLRYGNNFVLPLPLNYAFQKQ